jgi:hypothetical protein
MKVEVFLLLIQVILQIQIGTIQSANTLYDDKLDFSEDQITILIESSKEISVTLR